MSYVSAFAFFCDNIFLSEYKILASAFASSGSTRRDEDGSLSSGRQWVPAPVGTGSLDAFHVLMDPDRGVQFVGLDQDTRRNASLLKVAFQEGILLQQVTSTPERHLD